METPGEWLSVILLSLWFLDKRHSNASVFCDKESKNTESHSPWVSMTKHSNASVFCEAKKCRLLSQKSLFSQNIGLFSRKIGLFFWVKWALFFKWKFLYIYCQKSPIFYEKSLDFWAMQAFGSCLSKVPCVSWKELYSVRNASLNPAGVNPVDRKPTDMAPDSPICVHIGK